MKKLLTNISICIVTLMMMGSGCSMLDSIVLPDDQDVLRLSNRDITAYFIAHAGGSVYVDGEYITGTNSLEAIEDAYDQGFRYFEIDFSLTKDAKLVAFHDGAEARIGADKKIDDMTHAEFMNHTFLGEYTLIDIHDIVQLIMACPDIFIVTDFKSDFEQSLEVLNQFADPLRQHFIIQMYHPDQIDVLKKNHYSNIVFTLYRTDMNDDAVIDFIKQNPEVDAITMWWDKRFKQDFADRIGEEGLATYVHTINDPGTIHEFIRKRVGVYTDYVDVNYYVQSTAD